MFFWIDRSEPLYQGLWKDTYEKFIAVMIHDDNDTIFSWIRIDIEGLSTMRIKDFAERK